MRKSVSRTYDTGVFKLIVNNGYKFWFKIRGDESFERTQQQVLAIMENQYRELGELIKIVKDRGKQFE